MCCEGLTLELTPECMLALENDMVQGIQIGQVARETGLTVDAIRFYEKQRLLKPALRTEGGFRLFSRQDLQHIQFIRRAQELGFSLSEIRELLVLKGEQVEGCTHVRNMLTAKLDSVRQKIIELRKLENQLAADLKRCERRLHGQAGHATDWSLAFGNPTREFRKNCSR